jgi:hypothetical protein
MINVIARNELAQVWYIYNGTVEIDGPFGSKTEAYEAARVHETRAEGNADGASTETKGNAP